jgi:hypothetical protein
MIEENRIKGPGKSVGTEQDMDRLIIKVFQEYTRTKHHPHNEDEEREKQNRR